MLFTDAVYVGIDPTAGARPIHYAGLDRDLRLVALDEGKMEDVLAFVAGLSSAVIAVDAPQSPNQGRMLEAEVRRRYDLLPDGKTWGQWKVCEYELRRRNIRLYNTPSRVEDAPSWMRNGFVLYGRLRALGYRMHLISQAPLGRLMVEVHPHACFTVMLGHRPFLKKTLEGRMQRQMVLYLEGVDVADPMRVLEEMTRHSLLNGQLPLTQLREHDELDALMAAYVAYQVALRPNQVSQVGDEEEGLITLPVPGLKDFYH